MEDKKQKIRAAKIILWFAPAVAFAPVIIGIIGASLTPGCNESNCTWGVIPWYMFFTFPLGLIVMVIGLEALGKAKKPGNPNE